MNKKIGVGAVLGVALFALAGCEFYRQGQEEVQKAAVDGIACGDPLVARTFHEELGRALGEKVGAIVRESFPDLIDAERVIRGYERSRMVANSPKLDPVMSQSPQKLECVAGLTLMVDQTVLDLARSNAPLVYSGGRHEPEIDNVSSMNRISREDNNLGMEAHYSLELNEKRDVSGVRFMPQEIARMERVVRTMLLPYGVKDRVVVNGKVMSREEGLAKLAFADGSFKFEERPGEPGDPAAIDLAAGLEPPAPDPLEMGRLRSERDALRSRIERIWRSLDGTIREALSDEQTQWSRKLHSDCSPFPSKDSEGADGEKAALECEIERLRRRVSYLQGFGI